MKTLSFFPLLLIYLSITSQKAYSEKIYVAPHRSCLANCTGTLSNPHDSLYFALMSAASQSITSVEIILLASQTAEHYFLMAELKDQIDWDGMDWIDEDTGEFYL